MPGAHTPDLLCSFVGSLYLLRLSLKKGAYAVLSRAAYRKFGHLARFREMWDTTELARSFALTSTLSYPVVYPFVHSRNSRRVPHVRIGVARISYSQH